MAEATLPAGMVVAGARPAAVSVASGGWGLDYWRQLARRAYRETLEGLEGTRQFAVFAKDRFFADDISMPYRQPTLTFEQLKDLVSNLHVSPDFNLAANQRHPSWNNVRFAFEAATRFYFDHLSTGNDHGAAHLGVEERAQAFFKAAGFDMVRAFHDRGPGPNGEGTYDGLFLTKVVGDKVFTMAVHLGIHGNNDMNREVIGAAGRPHESGGMVHAAFYHEASFASQQLAQYMREVAARYPGKELVLQHIGHSKGGGMTPEIDSQVRKALAAKDGPPINVAYMPFVSGNGAPFGTKEWLQSVSHIHGYSVVADNDVVRRAQDFYNKILADQGTVSLHGAAALALRWTGVMPEGAKPYAYPGAPIKVPGSDRLDEAHASTTLASAAARWSTWQPTEGAPRERAPDKPPKAVPADDPKLRVSSVPESSFGPMVAGLRLAAVTVDKRDLPDGALPTELDGVPARQGAVQRPQEARVAQG